MKKIAYYFTVTVLCIVGFPVMILCRDRWNEFGRKVDAWFNIESPHTRNYNKSQQKQ